jgi:hypothetical protein
MNETWRSIVGPPSLTTLLYSQQSSGFLEKATNTMNRIIAVMLQASAWISSPTGVQRKKKTDNKPALNDGFDIHTLSQATTDMLSAINKMSQASASHSQPGLTSSHQKKDMLQRHTTAE